MTTQPGQAGQTTPSVTVPQQRRTETEEPTAGYGWVVFGAVMMAMVGAFHAIAGLVAIFERGYYLVGESGLVVSVNYTAWGWTHLALGVLAIAAGGALLTGRMWARVVTVVLAGLSAVVNLGFLAAYPIWSTIMIALDVLVIYAVVVHGREARAAR